MIIKRLLLAAAAAWTLGGVATATAQPIYPPPGNDPDGYYSRSDQDGYYGRDGHYHHMRHRADRYDEDNNDGPPPPNGPMGRAAPPPPPPGAYYEQGRYEDNCRHGNTAAGTIFGALAGGALGAGLSHGNGGAVIGGAVLGGLLGNTISRDIDCDDQPYAYRSYADGLNGDVGHRYEWRHDDAYGYFTPVREFRRGGVVCRDFTETSYRHGQAYTRTGTACRDVGSGNWRFD